ncbi:hypothetical protein A2U01_0051464, partial [Trifolium medium]|nr:hypothetical protein [Trifolium medium]
MIQRVARDFGNTSSSAALLAKLQASDDALPSPTSSTTRSFNNNNSNRGNTGRNSHRGNRGRNSGKGGRNGNGGSGSGSSSSGSHHYSGGGGRQNPPWQQHYAWKYPHWAPPPCPYPSYWTMPNTGPKPQQDGILGSKPQNAVFIATGPSPADIDAALH